jgi:hypothetical protein
VRHSNLHFPALPRQKSAAQGRWLELIMGGSIGTDASASQKRVTVFLIPGGATASPVRCREQFASRCAVKLGSFKGR